ncbi:hypothetical protein GOODEAATRI_028386 [Goodea atripinnis]|uniref:MHC class I antigen n=1 Tax=Goodea atripinnis TaxID=208336 RepID=A0ABV0NYI5_9TELE
MPTSRPGSEPVEFWVDGSRRDGTVEDFYTLGSELGSQEPIKSELLPARCRDGKQALNELMRVYQCNHAGNSFYQTA